METMSERIKRLRLQKGISQEELGAIVGVQKSAISKYERGYLRGVKQSVIKKMSDYFGVAPSYLMGYTDDPVKMTFSPKSEIEAEILRLCSTMTTREKTLLLAKAYEIIDKTEETK